MRCSWCAKRARSSFLQHIIYCQWAWFNEMRKQSMSPTPNHQSSKCLFPSVVHWRLCWNALILFWPRPHSLLRCTVKSPSEKIVSIQIWKWHIKVKRGEKVDYVNPSPCPSRHTLSHTQTTESHRRHGTDVGKKSVLYLDTPQSPLIREMETIKARCGFSHMSGFFGMTRSPLTSDESPRLTSLGGLRRSDGLTCYQLLRPHMHMFDIIGGCKNLFYTYRFSGPPIRK